MQPNDKPSVQPYGHFPNGLIVTPWGDGVMLSVVDQQTRHGIAMYMGHDGLVRLFSWLIASGIMAGEVEDEPRGDVMLQWPGPKPDAS